MLKVVRRRITYANVMSTVAVVIATAGTAYAAVLIGSPQIKNNSVKSVDIKNGTLQGTDVQNGSLATAKLNVAAQKGLSRAYASIGANGVIDLTRSYGITQSMVTTTFPGAYCINGFGFTPVNGAATINFEGSNANAYGPQLTFNSTNGGGCSPGTQVGVTTYVPASSSNTGGTRTAQPFYIAIW